MSTGDLRLLYLCADRGIPLGGTKGSSIHVREFLTALRNTNWDAEVVALRSECPDHTYLGYPLQVPEEPEAPFFAELLQNVDSRHGARELRSFYDNHRVEQLLDHVHQQRTLQAVYERYSLFGIAGLNFARRSGLPFVLEVNAPLVREAAEHRGLAHHELASDIERFLFTGADAVAVVSAELKRHVQQIAPHANVEVVPNGVNPRRFEGVTTTPSPWVQRESRDFVVGFVGTVRPWHGVDVLLTALPHLIAADPSFRVCIVGDGGDARDEFIARCEEDGVLSRIGFTGAVPADEIPQVLASMDVLVAPYPYMESFYFSPLKLFEYMAAGKPIVASAIGQINDIIVNGHTGLLVEPGDETALAQALLQLRGDANLCRRLGAAAHADALANHTWESRVQATLQVINRAREVSLAAVGAARAD